MVVLSRAFLHEHFLLFTYIITTPREHPVHHAHLQAASVDKLRRQESLWREELQSGGNPRTTTPTGYEPKELATVSRSEAYFWRSISIISCTRKIWRSSPSSYLRRSEEFGEIRTAAVPDSKQPERSYIQSQMRFAHSVESIAHSDLEDGELQKTVTSPLYAQKAWVKLDAMVVQEREVSADINIARSFCRRRTWKGLTRCCVTCFLSACCSGQTFFTV